MIFKHYFLTNLILYYKYLIKERSVYMPTLYRCEKNKNNYKCSSPPPPKPKPPSKKPFPPKKKKLNFKTCKKNTINSLNEVEHFLNDFQGFWDYVKLYKNVSNIFNRKKH